MTHTDISISNEMHRVEDPGVCGEHIYVETGVQALAHHVWPWKASLDELRSRSVPPYRWHLFLGRHKGKGVEMAIQYLFTDWYAT